MNTRSVTRALAISFVVAWATSLPADQTIPPGPLGDSTWSEGEVITLTGSITVIGELMIEPDVEVIVPAGGTIISVSSVGRMIASGEASHEIHFHSDGTPPMPGDWQAIRLTPALASESLFRHTIVEHARVGLIVQGASPSIEHCTFRNLGSRDGVDGSDGDPGTDGSAAPPAAGIEVDAGARPVIRDNLIETITGGNGGHGGNGVFGSNGFNGTIPGEEGGPGTLGGSGGKGGDGAEVTGITVSGVGTSAAIIGNRIRSLVGGEGGTGGYGGTGGSGGEGGPHGDGGDGAQGGSGGSGGAGGLAAGIRVTGGAVAVIASNEISSLQGGDGNRGDDAGSFGDGGRGGDGEDGGTNPVTPGQNGGDGGDAFLPVIISVLGGSGGAGGDARGISVDGATSLAAFNTIHDLTGGLGGGGTAGGAGGNGGDGGRGGDGVSSPSLASPGGGGTGGLGSDGTRGGLPGRGGAAIGIDVQSAATLTVVRDNEIRALRGGDATAAGEGGGSGDGGNGGPAGSGLLPAGGGAGGDAGEGGHSAGTTSFTGGDAIGVALSFVPGLSEVRGNRIHDLEGGRGADAGDVPPGGQGGNGGPGNLGGPGGAGGHGGRGADAGDGGVGGSAQGIVASNAATLTANNIIWDLQPGAPGLPTGGTTGGASGGPGGGGGSSPFAQGAGGDGGDGGNGGDGGRPGDVFALSDEGSTGDHYHETLADLHVGLLGTLPTTGGLGGAGGTGDPAGMMGTPGVAGAFAFPSRAVGDLARSGSLSTLNNAIFWQPAPGTAAGVSPEPGGTVQTDFNIYHNVGTPALGGPLGGNDLILDPLLANPASADFRLTRLSPAVDSGTARGITDDIDGHPRPFDVPTRGAEMTGFEFDRGAHESITGRTGYQTWELVEALLNGVTLSGPDDPLDVNDDDLFDIADVVANIEDINATLP